MALRRSLANAERGCLEANASGWPLPAHCSQTLFVIAHRLSTIAHADQILVLDRGEIIERGRHADLLDRRGTYHRLHVAQLRRGEGDAA